MDSEKTKYDMNTESEMIPNWVHLSLEERQTILANVAETKGIPDNAVEKDFWVSMVLRVCLKIIIIKV